jgi:hypothetical protein
MGSVSAPESSDGGPGRRVDWVSAALVHIESPRSRCYTAIVGVANPPAFASCAGVLRRTTPDRLSHLRAVVGRRPPQSRGAEGLGGECVDGGERPRALQVGGSSGLPIASAR